MKDGKAADSVGIPAETISHYIQVDWITAQETTEEIVVD